MIFGALRISPSFTHGVFSAGSALEEAGLAVGVVPPAACATGVRIVAIRIPLEKSIERYLFSIVATKLALYPPSNRMGITPL